MTAQSTITWACTVVFFSGCMDGDKRKYFHGMFKFKNALGLTLPQKYTQTSYARSTGLFVQTPYKSAECYN